MKVVHITNWYPNKWNPLEATFIKAHFDASEQYVEQELWHVQVRNEGSMFRIYIGDYSKNEHYIVVDTCIRMWKLQEILTLLLLSTLRMKLGRKWWDVVNVHIAYPLLRFTKTFMLMYGDKVVISEHWSAYKSSFFLSQQSKAAKRIANIFNYGLPVVAVSKALMADIVGFVGHSKFPQFIIPNVVDPAIFYSNLEPKRNLPNFLMVASWAKIKRPFLVMEAFVELLAEYPKAKLRIIGTGMQFREMQKFVDESNLKDNIKLLGSMNKEDIGREMRKSNCFLHASDYETFSVVCAEALSSGLPVIASNVGGIPEFVNSENGILVENTNDSWISALYEFVKSENKVDGSSSADTIGDKFSPNVIGQQYENVYRSYTMAEI